MVCGQAVFPSLQRKTACSFFQHLQKCWDKDSVKSTRVWMPVCGWGEICPHFLVEELALTLAKFPGIWHCRVSGCWKADKAWRHDTALCKAMELGRAAVPFWAAELEQMPAQGKCLSVVSSTFPLGFLFLQRSPVCWPCRSESRPFHCAAVSSSWYREGLGVKTPHHYSLGT